MTTTRETRLRGYYAYLNQGEVWIPADGKPRPIPGMDPAWRHNAANWLNRNSEDVLTLGGLGAIHAGNLVLPPDSIVLRPGHGLAGAWRRIRARRWARDPRSSPLYRALVDGLPDGVERIARHWSDCPVRAGGDKCLCRFRHDRECPKFDDVEDDVECRCRDFSPEWTI